MCSGGDDASLSPSPTSDYPSDLLAVDDEVWVASYGDGVVEILE